MMARCTRFCSSRTLPGQLYRLAARRVSGAKVTGTIVRQCKGKKIKGFTYVKVKAEQRHYGHRQYETTVRIEKIEA